jgi:hypothetical protein
MGGAHLTYEGPTTKSKVKKLKFKWVLLWHGLVRVEFPLRAREKGVKIEVKWVD